MDCPHLPYTQLDHYMRQRTPLTIIQHRESVEGYVAMMLTARDYNRLVKSLLFTCVRMVYLEKCVHR